MSDQSQQVYNGRYELHRKIARGGMAEVFLARDALLDRPVALKVLFPEFATDPSFVERFRREAQSAANLSHPNIVSVYDWGEEEGTYFIVMEYVEAAASPRSSRTRAPCTPTAPLTSPPTPPPPSASPTATGWSTATSSPATSSSTRRAR
jgi:serine/threonine-protein kinase